MEDPSPRKETDGMFIYLSRQMVQKGAGAPILCDFGSAVIDEGEHTEDIQPNVFRAPEVILGVPWTNAVDIWNVGCMASPLLKLYHWSLVLTDYRYGASLKAANCSAATIPNMKVSKPNSPCRNYQPPRAATPRAVSPRQGHQQVLHRRW